MRVSIIEDNLTEAVMLKEKVQELLEKHFHVSAIDVYASCVEYFESNTNYELYFIDCVLCDGNGTDLAKEIRKTNPGASIIFTTAYLEYAPNGYESDALRYLLKPISDKALEEAINAFVIRIQRSPVVELTGTARYCCFVPESDIYYIEYVGRKVLVRLEDRSVESTKTMKEFEDELSLECFFRSSRHFLVNFLHITKKLDNTLIMRNGERVIISKRNVNSFNLAYINYLKRG